MGGKSREECWGVQLVSCSVGESVSVNLLDLGRSGFRLRELNGVGHIILSNHRASSPCTDAKSVQKMQSPQSGLPEPVLQREWMLLSKASLSEIGAPHASRESPQPGEGVARQREA